MKRWRTWSRVKMTSTPVVSSSWRMKSAPAGVARLVLTARARDQLNRLPHSLRNAVVHTLADLAVEPDAVGKRLIGRLTGTWAARVGNYRVLYTIEGPSTSQRVVIRSIRHRAVAYGSRRR